MASYSIVDVAIVDCGSLLPYCYRRFNSGGRILSEVYPGGSFFMSFTRIFVRKLISGVVWNIASLGILLFLPALTLNWWQAWVLIGMSALCFGGMMAIVLRTRPDLMQERFKPIIQKGQPLTDRILLLAFVVSYTAVTIFIPLDVFHFHIFPKPSIWVSSLGLVLFLAGRLIITLVFKENVFAAPVVRHQAEREHKVVDTGVYSLLRHPMYTGISLMKVGMALWLESYSATILMLFPVVLLAARVIYEERFLRRELAGYKAYTEKVRFRLVPFVW
jgi:protein-S-isoprenylcysteine O-methyltransferase Ste14